MFEKSAKARMVTGIKCWKAHPAWWNVVQTLEKENLEPHVLHIPQEIHQCGVYLLIPDCVFS